MDTSTVKVVENSTRLIEKLGLQFERMIAHPDGNRELMLFSTALC